MAGEQTPLRVLFLTLYPDTVPSSRLRVYQYLPFLPDFGIHAAVIPTVGEPWFSRSRGTRSKAVRFLQHGMEFFGTFGRAFASRAYDVVFIQKGISTCNFRGMERFFIRAGSRLIFDLDDAVYGTPVTEFRWPVLRGIQDPQQAARLSRASRAVIAGNQYLKDLALAYNSNVYVVPTPVDTERIFPDRGEKAERQTHQKEILIGWLGMPSGLKYLSVVQEPLRRISEKYPVRFRVVSLFYGRPFEMPGVSVECADWSLEGENAALNQFDIALSPLFDTDWEKGKCSLKLLQYMAAGLPTVSSRVGMNCEVVRDGVSGFLADGPVEWVEKLSRLIEDRNLRNTMGQVAREKVEQDYSLRKTTSSLAGILRAVRDS